MATYSIDVKNKVVLIDGKHDPDAIYSFRNLDEWAARPGRSLSDQGDEILAFYLDWKRNKAKPRQPLFGYDLRQ